DHSRRQVLGAAGGAIVMLVLAVAMTLLPAPRRLNWFLDADNVRHVVYLADVWTAGTLDYVQDSYPRGWHATQALLWSSIDREIFAQGVVVLRSLSAVSFWITFSVVALTCELLGVFFASACRSTPRAQFAAGVAAGAAPLWLSFSGVYLGNGYQTSVVAAV